MLRYLPDKYIINNSKYENQEIDKISTAAHMPKEIFK
jgi:hypothetical protein